MGKGYDLQLFACARAKPGNKIRIVSRGTDKEEISVLSNSKITCPLSKICMAKLNIKKNYSQETPLRYSTETDQKMNTLTAKLHNCIEQESESSDSDQHNRSASTSISSISNSNAAQSDQFYELASNQQSRFREYISDRDSDSDSDSDSESESDPEAEVEAGGHGSEAVVLCVCLLICGILSLGYMKMSAIEEMLKKKGEMLKKKGITNKINRMAQAVNGDKQK